MRTFNGHAGAGFCAIVGGYVVRDHSLGGLYGRYIYGDYCNSRLYSARLRPGHASGDRALPSSTTITSKRSRG